MNRVKRFLKALGPGVVTGAADDDPSGIAAYSQTGAQFGYSQLWVALFSFPFMSIIQEMCGRIGLVSGKGLAGVMRHHYARPLLYGAVFILLIANTVNIGADLGAMASTGQLVLHVPFAVWLIGITVLSLLLQVFVSYHLYARVLKYLTFALFAYVVTAFIVKQPWLTALHATVVPSFSLNKDYLMNIVALLGTNISPYLFFWQASEEVEEEVEKHELKAMGVGRPKLPANALGNMRIDTVVGMLFSNLVMFFVIMTSASTLGAHGMHSVQTADQAAQALRPLAGDFVYVLFAAGIIGTGLLAVPVLAGSTSYAFSEAFGWKEGLYRKFKKAHGFYGVITLATLAGLLINFLPIPSFTLLYYTAILNGICAPPLMILIMLVANNKKIMGPHRNGLLQNIFGWLITLVMAGCAIMLLVTVGR